MRPRRTGGSDDLTFQPQLILETTRDPTGLPVLAHGDVRRPLDLVPHVPARKGDDQHDRGRAPHEATHDQR